MHRIPIAAGAFLMLILATVSYARQEHEHEFVFKPDGAPKTVHVAGSFNGWSKDATPMTRGEDGAWRAKVKLAEGIHHYKFLVDGEQWLPDPTSDKSLDADDNFGGKNSGVLIGPDIRKAPLARPNHVNVDFVLHDPSDPADADNLGDGRVRLRLRAQAGDVQHVGVYVDRDEQALSKVNTFGGFDSFVGIVGNFGGRTPATYHFGLEDGTKDGYLSASGFVTTSQKTKLDDFIVPPPRIVTPDWAKHAVWYQIFPERFRNGDTSNDPGDKEYERLVPWTHDWWKTAPGEAEGDENFYRGQGNIWKRRYGGDIQGLRQALPYLKKLGVNAIYLNPVFEADSLHKYDCSDYRHIDDNFGFKGDIQQLEGETDDPARWKWTKSDRLFLDFLAEAHAQGFKVIIDGVFNHVGKSHPFFQDVIKHGKKSKYADWFEITDWSHPIQYKAWDRDNGDLPVFKKDADRGLANGPRQHVFAITRRWLAPNGDPSRGVDGWRLDVPGDIPHPFWIEWRKHVKSIKPDAYITGEIWTWAQPWLRGDQFDAVMNYRFAEAAKKFFVNQRSAVTPGEFNGMLNEIVYAYPFQVALAQQNLFDSHDTDRLVSMFVNPDLPFDQRNRIQDNGPDYKRDKPTPAMYQRMRQAIAMQMSFVGAPMLYYGTEAGMWGPDDPSNRMPMVWPELNFDDPQVKFDAEMFEFCRRAIALRHALPQLRLGFFRGVKWEDERGVYVFARELGDERAYVIVNRSDQARRIDVPVDGRNGAALVNWLDPAQATIASSHDGRPMLQIRKEARGTAVTGGRLSINLQPFETAVLTQPQQ